jgi:hypothetical protein
VTRNRGEHTRKRYRPTRGWAMRMSQREYRTESWPKQVDRACYDFSSLFTHMPISACLFQISFRIPRLVSHVTFPFHCHTSFIICRRGFPSSLSRTLTHHAYFLISLSPTSCTILRPVVVGPSQAFFVFNLS